MDFSPLLILLKWQDTAHANIGCLRMVMCSNTIKNRGEALFLGSGIKLIFMVFWAQSYLCKPFFLAVSAKKRNFCGSAATFKGCLSSPLTENERKATRQSRGHSSLPCARSPRR